MCLLRPSPAELWACCGHLSALLNHNSSTWKPSGQCPHDSANPSPPVLTYSPRALTPCPHPGALPDAPLVPAPPWPGASQDLDTHVLHTAQSTRGSDSARSHWHLPNVQENSVWLLVAVEGDRRRPVAGSVRTEGKAQVLLEREETLQSGCSSLHTKYEAEHMPRAVRAQERSAARSLPAACCARAPAPAAPGASEAGSRPLSRPWPAHSPSSSGLLPREEAAHSRCSACVAD